ncbi:MAG: YceI family protein [Bacteroidia bacterium]|nr:YceI family protein [Bacteroidia bacterium]
MSISGTSNLHDWVSQVQKITATGDVLMSGGDLKGIQSLWVGIDVYSIKSSKGSIMDGKTYDALKASQFNTITYQLGRMESVVKQGTDYQLRAQGALTIAGVTRQVPIDAKARVLPSGEIEFSGSKQLLMSSFGIAPPTALLGTLTTGDEVTITFSVTMGR